MNAPADEAAESSETLPPFGKRVLFPNTYVWFVFLSAMDVLMTFTILYFGGREANKLADWVLQNFGLAGMTVYKFVMVVIVILICEVVGRLRYPTGRRLAEWSVALTCVPVVIAFTLLIYATWFQDPVGSPWQQGR